MCSPAQFVVRPAALSDLARIVEFNERLAEETESRQLDRVTLEEGVRTLLLDPGRGRYFVAERDGQVIGQIMHTREWSDWRNGELWWIQSVYVAPSNRRQGVFRALLVHLRQLAHATTDVVGLRLYVEHSNREALLTYQRLGLSPAGYEVMEETWPRPPEPT